MVWKWAGVNCHWQKKSTPTFVCESWQRFVVTCYQGAAVCASSSMEYASRVPDGTGNKSIVFVCLLVWDSFASDRGLCFQHPCVHAYALCIHAWRHKWSIAQTEVIEYSLLLCFLNSMECCSKIHFVFYLMKIFNCIVQVTMLKAYVLSHTVFCDLCICIVSIVLLKSTWNGERSAICFHILTYFLYKRSGSARRFKV